MTGIPLPLAGLAGNVVLASVAEQLVLIGQPRPIRVPERRWRSWLDDPAVVARFEAKRFKRANGLCWAWIGGVSSTGHGSFRAASLPGPSRRGTVPAHLFAYQLAYGVIPRLGWSGAEDAMICHQCDFAGCTNPAHMRLGTNLTPPIGPNTSHDGRTWPAHWPTCAGQPDAPAPSPQPSEPGWNSRKIRAGSRDGFVPPKLRAFPSRCGDGKRYQPSYYPKHGYCTVRINALCQSRCLA